MSKEKLFLDSFKNLVQEKDPKRRKALANKTIQIFLETKPLGDFPESLKVDDPEENREIFELFVRLEGRGLIDEMKRIYFKHSGLFE